MEAKDTEEMLKRLEEVSELSWIIASGFALVSFGAGLTLFLSNGFLAKISGALVVTGAIGLVRKAVKWRSIWKDIYSEE